MAARVTFPLQHPVTVAGVRHEALHLRPVKKCDRRRVRGGTQYEVGVDLAARLAGVPVAIIYALEENDREAVGVLTSQLLG